MCFTQGLRHFLDGWGCPLVEVADSVTQPIVRLLLPILIEKGLSPVTSKASPMIITWLGQLPAGSAQSAVPAQLQVIPHVAVQTMVKDTTNGSRGTLD